MDTKEIKEITVKKEPVDNNNGNSEDSSQNHEKATRIEATSSPIQAPLRYVSRRGRPPGGGYSMKSPAHYVSFSSIPLSTAADLGRQISNGSSSSISPQDLITPGTSASTENLDIRRFGFSGSDTEKNSFRCDGCDVVFSSRDTYAMHMLLRAKNESCVALPTSAISSNPENPTPREKFERELRQQTMVTVLRNQAAAMSKAATDILTKSDVHSHSISSVSRSASIGRDVLNVTGGCSTDGSFSFNNLFSVDAYGLYVDPRQYRRVLEEYGLRTSSSNGSLQTMIEQLSCTDCGEVFSSKDALAMHMMYHTRDDDKESATIVKWTDVGPASSRKQQPTCSSTSSSPSQCASSRRKNMTESSDKVKRDMYKAEDRELTAERVAELKRLAIESSLRSTPKKSTSRQITRPKSVSQDIPATISVQNRPLSADDVRKFTTSVSRRDEKRNGSIFLNNFTIEAQNEINVCHKRRSSALSVSDASEVGHLEMDISKRKRNSYEDMFYNLFYRSKKVMSSFEDFETDKNSISGVNHARTVLNTLDSDDRSESSSSTNQELSATICEQASFSKARSIPYLDAIMSQEAVLVPLDTAISIGDSGRIMERVKTSAEDNPIIQSSAIDFSIGRRDTRDKINGSNWYVPQQSHDNTNNENQNESIKSQFPSSTVSERNDKNEPNRNRLFQYQNSDRSLYSQLEHTGQSSSKRLSSATRPGLSSGNNHQNGPSRNWMDESTSRVSEARYCPHCEILYLDVTLFHLHMGLHNVNNPWQCNTCGLVCSGRLDFNTHVLHY